MKKSITRNGVNLEEILRCPTCMEGNCKFIQDVIICSNCKSNFDFKGNVPVLLDMEASPEIKELISKQSWEGYDIENVGNKAAGYFYNKKSIWQKLSPKYRVQVGPTYTEFFKKYYINGRVLDLGGGPNSLNKIGMVNLDVNDYPTVDIIGDARRMPFSNNSFDAIISNSMLEHIWEVDKVVSESYRITKSGGFVFFGVPLICARHHTKDFHRWTLPGLEKLFEKFEVVEKGTILGPGMYLHHIVINMITSCFGNNVLSNLTKLIMAYILFPVRFLDYLGRGTKEFESYSHTIYIIAKKH